MHEHTGESALDVLRARYPHWQIVAVEHGRFWAFTREWILRPGELATVPAATVAELDDELDEQERLRGRSISALDVQPRPGGSQ